MRPEKRILGNFLRAPKINLLLCQNWAASPRLLGLSLLEEEQSGEEVCVFVWFGVFFYTNDLVSTKESLGLFPLVHGTYVCMCV